MKNTGSKNPARGAGILMPVSSIPSPYGIGTLGEKAYAFVDFLRESGQKYWQVLPVGPTSYGDSPYQSFSAYAGNPYFIDPDTLCREGLLTKEECGSYDWGQDSESVDYSKIYQSRFRLLEAAYKRSGSPAGMEKFCAENEGWLPDYALYMAIKETMGMRSWTEWDEELKRRCPEALERCRKELGERIGFYTYLQYLFFGQWGKLKEYAKQNGIRIIGDIPIYVSMDSADVWAGSDMFLLDESKNPIEVAGCPPDAFSETGQLWGNPLYRWDRMEEQGYDWWINRLAISARLYDVLRIDHFRGFESYYAIPYGDATAENGVWKKGPGMKLFHAVQERLPGLDVIAEDLGFLTDDVRQLLRDSGYPGMKVLEFAFDSREESDYLPHNYEKNCVVYTGTHDNDTVRGWFENAAKEDVALACRYLNIRDIEEGNWAFIRAAYASVANLAIVQMQDFLNLGATARINTPSTLGQNWKWRMRDGVLTRELSEKIYGMTRLYGR